MPITDKERAKLKRAYKKVKACSGICNKCDMLHIYTSSSSNAFYFCFGCDLLPDYYIGERLSTLKADTLRTIEFELS